MRFACTSALQRFGAQDIYYQEVVVKILYAWWERGRRVESNGRVSQFLFFFSFFFFTRFWSFSSSFCVGAFYVEVSRSRKQEKKYRGGKPTKRRKSLAWYGGTPM
jgi:hypothetical protein